MNQKILEAANALHECLENDARVIALKVLEKNVQDDPELQLLSSNIKKLEIEINAKLEYLPLENAEVKKIRRELFAQKYVLDTHPLIKEYNERYKEVNALYHHVSKTLSKIFDEGVSCKCQ